MKNNFLLNGFLLATIALPAIVSAQAPTLGSSASFALYSSNGAITNTGITHVTGNVGTNSGASTGFGNVNGVMHDNDLVSAQCSADLLVAYNQLNATIPLSFPSSLLGNGDTLTPSVYETAGATVLNGHLYLDAQGDPNAVFILRIQGPLSTGAGAKVHLINSALACNVYWKIEGLVSMASGTTMRGTLVANNAAINMTTNDTLEGRALSTAGAVSTDGVLVYTPVGCGSPALNGPVAPALASTECYAIFSSSGAVTNSGITNVTGDIGTNTGLTTGYNASLVNGTIHPIPDGSTAACASDLNNVYNYLNVLPHDIELLYPAQFGNNLVLTPHTYLLNAGTTLTDTLYLNAMNNANAVFVIKMNGALTTSTYARVVLINGAQARNVYWLIQGAVSINNYSVFKGTIVCNNGAIDLGSGTQLDGRALTTNGNINTSAVNVIIPPGCVPTTTGNITEAGTQEITVYPNPVIPGTPLTLHFPASVTEPCTLTIQNAAGAEVMNRTVTDTITPINTGDLLSGIYFYRVIDCNGNQIGTGRFIVSGR